MNLSYNLIALHDAEDDKRKNDNYIFHFSQSNSIKRAAIVKYHIVKVNVKVLFIEIFNYFEICSNKLPNLQ
jgi:hypothetical protein